MKFADWWIEYTAKHGFQSEATGNAAAAAWEAARVIPEAARGTARECAICGETFVDKRVPQTRIGETDV